MGEEFKAIMTQEEFEEATRGKLERQKETLEKQYEDYEMIKSKNTELETEIGTLKSTLADTNSKKENYENDLAALSLKIAEHEAANMRTRIALQKGIPYELASRLAGDDEKSITKDAEKLASLIKSREPIAPLRSVEPTIEGKNGAYKSLLDNLNLEGE